MYGDLNRLAEASLKRCSGQLMGHCCALWWKLIICGKSSEKLNWVLACRVRCTHREPRLMDSNTEPSSPSRSPASERTNRNHSLNMQTEKYVKKSNSAPARGFLCTQGGRRETRLNKLKHRICLLLLLYRQIHAKWCQNTHLGEYPRQTVGNVLRESKQLRNKSDVHHYTGCIAS